MHYPEHQALDNRLPGLLLQTAFTDAVNSDVQYIDFISISRYFCSYRTVSKSILHLLMLDNYRTAEFSNNISNYQA